MLSVGDVGDILLHSRRWFRSKACKVYILYLGRFPSFSSVLWTILSRLIALPRGSLRIAALCQSLHPCPSVHFGQLVTLPMDDVIPVTLKSTLERVCRKFFNRDAAHKSPKHQRFVELYQATFEKDFEVIKEAEELEKREDAVAWLKHGQ